MTTLKIDPKFFKSMARLQKRVARLYDADFIAIYKDHVQVTLEVIVRLAEFGELAVRDGYRPEPYPWEAQIVIEGVRYLAIGTEQEFIDAGVFTATVQSWGG